MQATNITASFAFAPAAPAAMPAMPTASTSRSSPATLSRAGRPTQTMAQRVQSPTCSLRRLATDNRIAAQTSSAHTSQMHSSHNLVLPHLQPLPPSASASSPRSVQAAAAAQARVQRQKQAAIDSQMKALYESEYREEVLGYMCEMEGSTMANVELIDMQPELAWYMRPYLIDFLIEIHSQYRLRPETLYLAINIVDRYVSRRIVYKKHYQLVGCAALWIASKFEDAKDRVPTVEDLCAVCCSAYDQSAFIQMEGHVLSTINWLLGHPTSEAWLRIACCPSPTQPMEDTRTQHVARFIMEITLFHRAFVPIKPSDIAQACLLLARHITSPDELAQPKADERTEAVKIAQMLDAHLAEHLEQVSATVVKKYSPSFYSRASIFVREWYLSGRRFVQTTPAPLPSQPVVHTSDVDMSPSSSSSNSEGRDSDYEEHDDDEDYLTGPSSEPLTPTTSIGSSACASDPFDADSMPRGQERAMHMKTQNVSGLCVPVPQRVADLQSKQAHDSRPTEDMHWQ